MTDGATKDTIAALGPWFQNLHLPDGTQTAPDHWLGDFPDFKWRQIAPRIPERLDGWTVLEVGCNAAFYSIQLALRGAHVTAIDMDPKYLRQARWAAEQFGVGARVDIRQMQVYDLAHDDTAYDLVLFMGVFYHLRYPALGLDIVAGKVRRLLVFQTLTLSGDTVYPCDDDYPFERRDVLREEGWPAMAFVEKRFAGDPTNWWIPNRAAIEALLRTAGLEIIERPEQETCICRPTGRRPGDFNPGNPDELQIATGQQRDVPRSK